jgi:ABC-2 type transport system permease protein
MALGLVVAAVAIVLNQCNAAMILLPFYIFFIGMFAIGIGWIVASLQVYLRDTSQVLSVGLTFWFWLTPIFITEDQFPERLRFLIAANPLAYVVRAYREILLNLVRKELKVKYTASVLGAVWSLLNPLVFLGVFTFVSKVLGAAIADYPVFLLSGLLAWNVFSVALNAGAQSVIQNANLVKKVYFPREILPLATVGVALVDFVLQSLVFFAFIVLTGYGFVVHSIWLYPLAFVTMMVFTMAATFWVSSMNVRYRDVQHLIALGLLVWFWLTPIVYAAYSVYDKTRQMSLGAWFWRIYLLNPMAWVVTGFQHALYHSTNENPVLSPITDTTLGLWLLVVIAVSTVLLYVCWRIYFALSGDFAEEL